MNDTFHDMNYRNGRRIRVITLGACAVCAQTLFLREIFGIVTGTELVLGLAIASWLFWIGAGGLIGGRLLRRGAAAEITFSGLSLSLALSVPLIVLFIRIGRSLLVDPPGSIPDILPAAGFILVATAPFGLLYGAIYNYASTIMTMPEWRSSTEISSERTSGICSNTSSETTSGICSNTSSETTSGISSAYIFEAAGCVAGGIVLSLLFLAFLTQLEAAFAVSTVVLFIFLITSVKGRRVGWVIALLIAVAGFVMGPQLDRASMSMVFSGYEVMDVVPSQYAELCITRNRETISVYSGGSIIFSHPDPESAGERVHIPLLAHNAPGSVLMIGGGPGGGLEEALSHPGVADVDWIELDGNLPDISKKTAGGGEESVGSRILTGDGRFLIQGDQKYDVIIVTVPEPATLMWNRYFTREFFESARRSLLPGGTLALRHGASENYISTANAAVLGIIRETLFSTFKYVDIVPGGTVYFIASESPVEIEAIPERLVERGLAGRLLTLDALSWRISRERKEDLEAALSQAPRLINTDLHPFLVSRELIHHRERSGGSTRGFLNGLLRLPPWILPAALLALVILVGIPARRDAATKAAVCITGFCGMTVQISLMMAYQVFAGTLYHTLVILTVLFMAGTALGAYWAGGRQKRGGRSLRYIHLLMAATAFLVPLWLMLQGVLVPGQMAGKAGFMILAAAGGLLTGAYYRTAVETAWPTSGNAPPALFYSWDMFGACAGGLLAGTFLIPISGLVWTAATAAAIHVTAAIIITRKIHSMNP